MAQSNTLQKRALSDDDLVRIIDDHWSDGIGSDHGDLSNDRQAILDRYMGELYGDELQGESKVVSRDVFETVEWAMAALVRKFTSGDRPVQFVPVDPRDEIQAKVETEAVHDMFWEDNNGFTITYLILKSLLLNPNGYVKVSRVESTRAQYDTFKDLTLADLDVIDQDAEVEIVEQSSYMHKFQDNGPEIELYEVRIKRTIERGRNVVMVLPEDEVCIDGEWTDPDLDECPFTCHAPEKTHSELLEMGVPEDVLERNYGKDTASVTTAEENNRKEYGDERDTDDESHYALRKYRFYEAYMLADVDGDGIAERYIVHKVGTEVVFKEPTDEQAIISGASILLPHRHIGYSLAQSVMDLQRIRTQVWRQLLNNMYLVNNPKKKVTKGANLNDVLANRSNNVLRVTSPDDVTFESPTPMISQIAPLIDLIDNEKEMRSGVTKNATVPNADLVKQSAEGTFNNLIDRADQRLDLVARLFGETVFRAIFLKLHNLAIKYGDIRWLKFEGQNMQVDPRTWKRRERVRVKVGLGFNSGSKKLAAATAVKADHDALMQTPLAGVLVSPSNIYNGRKAWLEAMGEEDVDMFYINPTINPPQPKPQAPDPNLLMIQSNERIEGGRLQLQMLKLRQEGQMAAMKAQAEFALRERELAWKQQESQIEAQVERLKNQLAQEQAAGKATAERTKLRMEAMQTALEDARNDEKLAVEKYKADLAAETQLTLKKWDMGMNEMDEFEDMDTVRKGIQDLQQSMQSSVEQLNQTIEEMRQPWEIEYDDDGEVVGKRNPVTNELRLVRRNDAGDIIGF